MSAMIKDVIAAVESGRLDRFRTLVETHFQTLHKGGWIRYLLSSAATDNNLVVVKLLVELGADINTPESDERPEGIIVESAGSGAVDVVAWLLTHGARLNHDIDGNRRCFALSRAAGNGHLEVVQLLIAGGAEIDASWNGMTALKAAILNGHGAVATYLRSAGDKEPDSLKG